MELTAVDDRMKFYEQETSQGQYLMPLVPWIVRLDGKAFHTWTRQLERPFSTVMHEAMLKTTIALVKLSNALVGYTQSDEISLLLYSSDIETQRYFNGKIDKLNSVLAAFCSVEFNKCFKDMPSALFDCRCFAVPTLPEAAEYFKWREADAVRNSIQSLAQSKLTGLKGQSCKQLQERLWQECNINWNDLPSVQKRGTYVLARKRTTTLPLTAEEIEALPPLHEARQNPDITRIRTAIEPVELPSITKITNLVDVLFNGLPAETA